MSRAKSSKFCTVTRIVVLFLDQQSEKLSNSVVSLPCLSAFALQTDLRNL